MLLVYPSANRDERAFDEPDGLDITREPNDHVAFGAGGPHFCLGANLARLESRLMFEAILTRFDGLEVAADPATLPRVHSNLIDGSPRCPCAGPPCADMGARDEITALVYGYAEMLDGGDMEGVVAMFARGDVALGGDRHGAAHAGGDAGRLRRIARTDGTRRAPVTS